MNDSLLKVQDMSLKFYTYILFFPFLLFTSCVEDNLTGTDNTISGNEVKEEGTEFEIMLENPGLRSRSVNFTPNSSVKINSVWMGVFDRTTGACIARNSALQRYLEIQSGNEYRNLIRIVLPPPPAANRNNAFFVVCVVNYQDVQDQYGNLLEDRLADVGSWYEFIDIAVDTQSAYSYPHDSDAPLMAGFLRTKDESKRSAAHVQVNQFDQNRLYPDQFTDDIQITYSNNAYTTSNRVVILRRLVANINVNIEVTNTQIDLTSVNFKRFNIPEKVFIIERRTVKDDSGIYEAPTDTAHAANYADKLWVASNHTQGYTYDTEWQISPNRDSQTGKWSFNFQHFANKHWARSPLTSYNQREARTQYVVSSTIPDPENEENSITVSENKYYFSALANNENDFNNNASYFVIKMHLVDADNNKCAEAEYTIHEGNTSNADGTEVADKSGNLNDFVCARNISYLYNVKVAGFNNIFSNVEGNGSSSSMTQHHPDQGGKVWQLHYANDIQNTQGKHYQSDSNGGVGNFLNISPANGPSYSESIEDKTEQKSYNYCKYEGAISVGIKPNLAFRLYGYTNHRTRNLNSDNSNDPGITAEPGIAGWNYNFERSSFDNLSGVWPPSAGDYSHYFQDQASLDITKIPEDLRNGVLITDPSAETLVYMNLVQFIEYANRQTEPKTYDVYIRESELDPVAETEKNDYIRALYIADRNGVVDTEDGCSTRVDVFCAAQFPPIKQ